MRSLASEHCFVFVTTRNKLLYSLDVWVPDLLVFCTAKCMNRRQHIARTACASRCLPALVVPYLITPDTYTVWVCGILLPLRFSLSNERDRRKEWGKEYIPTIPVQMDREAGLLSGISWSIGGTAWVNWTLSMRTVSGIGWIENVRNPVSALIELYWCLSYKPKSGSLQPN